MAASTLTKTNDPATIDRHQGDAAAHRIADRAPGLIWDAFGDLLAFELDPKTADPAQIHQMRIAAKKLRYTLEAFEHPLDPSVRLKDATALQDAAGEMHDAIVARDLARSFLRGTLLRGGQRRAIGQFAKAQDHRAEASRTTVARRLTSVGNRVFRGSLDRAVVAIARGRPRSASKRR